MWVTDYSEGVVEP